MKSFAKSERGAVAIVLGLAATALFMVAGGAVDYGMAIQKKARLQAMADAGAIAGGNALTMANNSSSTVISIATTHALQSSTDSMSATVSASAKTDGKTQITVEVEELWQPIFSHLIFEDITPIRASATAQRYGSTNICVLALHPSMGSSLSLTGAAQLQANGCGVYANSTDAAAITSWKDSLIASELTCSAGGYGGSTKNFNPQPSTDCPKVADPLAGRQPPDITGCDYNNLTITSEIRTLSPGVYCGGLGIYGTSQIKLSPGVYVIKDGPLQTTQTSSVTGENVGFYMTGDTATFVFAGGSSVELTAPTDGPLAGLLFYEDPNSLPGRRFEIVSDNARRLVGTIYLPKGEFLVSSKKPVADMSEYTAVIASSIQLHRYPNLVLNTNYGATNVPVPTGLSSMGGKIVLTQ